eukprot:1160462-Pelagomonas_calceolata.AAC.2
MREPLRQHLHQDKQVLVSVGHTQGFNSIHNKEVSHSARHNKEVSHSARHAHYARAPGVCEKQLIHGGGGCLWGVQGRVAPHGIELIFRLDEHQAPLGAGDDMLRGHTGRRGTPFKLHEHHIKSRGYEHQAPLEAGNDELREHRLGASGLTERLDLS